MMASADSYKAVLTSLQLLESGGDDADRVSGYLDEVTETTCLLCDDVFTLTDLNPILKHLVEEHRFVIAGVKMIADFKKYAEYWKKRLQEMPITHFCSVIVTNTGPNDTAPQERFNLLCDILPEDKELRQSLQKTKLEEILAQQALERESKTFNRGCLFCKERFQENRSDLLNHMASEHSFSIGKPDNLVFVNEFLDKLQDKLDRLQCLYCENTFKDRLTLKEHMRKKNHKRIKSTNSIYDKYYVINYLEFGRKWEESQNDVTVEEDSPEQSEHEDDWSDWRESADIKVVCLFCSHSAISSPQLLEHMKASHSFDLDTIRQRHQLSFYQQIKLINYVRRQIYQRCCIYCDLQCDTAEELSHHMTMTGHISQVPDVKTWDQPQYYFPTYEDDAFLYALDNAGDEDDCTVEADCTVYAEADCTVYAEADCTVYAEDAPTIERLMKIHGDAADGNDESELNSDHASHNVHLNSSLPVSNLRLDSDPT